MAGLLSSLTTVNVTLVQSVESDKSTGEFESVEMGDSTGSQRKVKVPRRIIHFANGDTMEEYSTDEEEEDPVKKDVVTVDPGQLTWGPYFWFHLWRLGTSTIAVCDYMGERLASLFGISTPKYQYAIDEYYRMKKEEEEEEEENHLSEDAERRFAEQQKGEQGGPHSAIVEEQGVSKTSFVNFSYELDPKSPLSPVPSSLLS